MSNTPRTGRIVRGSKTIGQLADGLERLCRELERELRGRGKKRLPTIKEMRGILCQTYAKQDIPTQVSHTSGDTPRTDAGAFWVKSPTDHEMQEEVVSSQLARQIEGDLNEMRRNLDSVLEINATFDRELKPLNATPRCDVEHDKLPDDRDWRNLAYSLERELAEKQEVLNETLRQRNELHRKLAYYEREP